MTPQEKDLITALLGRLQQQANQPKDPEAEALIRRAMAQQQDAPYLLVQTVLIQDMALTEAQRRLKELEDQVRSAPPAAAPQPASFLPSGARGSVPNAGPWGAPPQPQPQPPVWTQSGAAGAPPPAYAPPGYAPSGYPPAGYAPQPGYPPMAPLAAPSAAGGFLRQAATTAAGVAGGALLFQGIESLFGQHYGGGFLGGMPMQPGIGETVVNNYYTDTNTTYNDAPGGGPADYTPADNYNDPGVIQADDQDYGNDPGQDYGSDQDFGGGDGGSSDV